MWIVLQQVAKWNPVMENLGVFHEKENAVEMASARGTVYNPAYVVEAEKYVGSRNEEEA